MGCAFIMRACVCVCAHACDCGTQLDSVSEASMTYCSGVCVCTPDLSRVADSDSDGYACVWVKFVAGLSNTTGM